MQAHGIMFHHFTDDHHPPVQGAMTADDLRDLIRFVGRQNILSAKEWLDRALNNDLDANHRCLTFDDNLRCQYDIVLPVLQSEGLTAFWFVYTSPLEGKAEKLEVYRQFRTTHFTSVDEFYSRFFRSVSQSEEGTKVREALNGFDPRGYLPQYPYYSDSDRVFRYVRDHVLGTERYNRAMDKLIAESDTSAAEIADELWLNAEQIKHLHDTGHIIGLHSHTHPTVVSGLPTETQAEEFERNRKALADIIGTSPTTAAHPCNSYDAATLSIFSDMGVRMAFRADQTKTEHGLLEMPREDHANIMARMKRYTVDTMPVAASF